MVSWLWESHVGICELFAVQASYCHMTLRIIFVIRNKKCTQNLKIIPYLHVRYNMPIPTVARVRNLYLQPLVLCVKFYQNKLGPGPLSLSLLNDSRMCKVYNKYKICNMQREGPAGRAGFESMFIDWNPPPPILDWLSNVLPGWVWGFLLSMN
jgi:hypothetical protein